MSKFRLTNSNLNVDGFRILTTGGDLTRFKSNPICLWMHRRYFDDKDPLPIGKWVDIEVKGDEILAEPVLDTKDPFAVKIQAKVEQEIIRMASVGIRVIEVSDDPKYLLPGQTRMTITKWEMVEASLVDIGRHSEALRLYDENYEPITEEMSFSLLPALEKKQETQNQNNMKIVALKLGLTESATEADIMNKIAELQNSLNTANGALEDIAKRNAENLVDTAVAAGKITADKKESFVRMAMGNYDDTKTILDAIAPVQKPGNIIQQSAGNGGASEEIKTFGDVLKLGSDGLEKFKAENPDEYKTLYALEYGVSI
jgi:uncharacterized surface protein with fasciclin (FAS1) repeats